MGCEMRIEIALVRGRENGAGSSPSRLVDDLGSRDVLGLGSSWPEPDFDRVRVSSHGVAVNKAKRVRNESRRATSEDQLTFLLQLR